MGNSSALPLLLLYPRHYVCFKYKKKTKEKGLNPVYSLGVRASSGSRME